MARLFSLDNQKSDFYYKLAREQAEKGYYADAIANLTVATSLENKVGYRVALAEIYYKNGNYLQSTDIYTTLFAANRQLSFAFAIFRNLNRLGRSIIARKFILHALEDANSLTDEEIEQLEETEDMQLLMDVDDGVSESSFVDVTDIVGEFAVSHLKSYVDRGDYDEAISLAAAVPKTSKFYEATQEVICICAAENGDNEVLEATARRLLDAYPHNVIAFGALLRLGDKVKDININKLAAEIVEAYADVPAKLAVLLKAAYFAKNEAVLAEYEDYIINKFPCNHEILTIKMCMEFLSGQSAEGSKTLLRLNKLFLGDSSVMAYNALYSVAKYPEVWERVLYMGGAYGIEPILGDICDKLFDARKEKYKRECAAALIKYDTPDDVYNSIFYSLGAPNVDEGMLNAVVLPALKDLSYSDERREDVLAALLMCDVDAVADYISADNYIFDLHVKSIGINKAPLKIKRLYTRVFLYLIDAVFVPDCEALTEVFSGMLAKGVKPFMVDEALAATAAYIYLHRDDTPNIKEPLDGLSKAFDANLKTLEKYLTIFC